MTITAILATVTALWQTNSQAKQAATAAANQTVEAVRADARSREGKRIDIEATIQKDRNQLLQSLALPLFGKEGPSDGNCRYALGVWLVGVQSPLLSSACAWSSKDAVASAPLPEAKWTAAFSTDSSPASGCHEVGGAIRAGLDTVRLWKVNDSHVTTAGLFPSSAEADAYVQVVRGTRNGAFVIQVRSAPHWVTEPCFEDGRPKYH